MNKPLQHILLAATLAAASATAFANPAAAPDSASAAEPKARHARAAHHSHCKEERADAFKSQLQLNPSQEAAWERYLAALQPTSMPTRADRAELRSLTTPQRLDRMRTWRQQRDSEFERRSAATLEFYAVLSPEQQALFDQHAMRALRSRGHSHRR